MRTRSPIYRFLIFTGIAYAIAWGLFLVFVIEANSLENIDAATLISLVEAGKTPATNLPSSFLYALTRVIDYSFSISGIISILMFQGVTGIKNLWSRLDPRGIRPIIWLIAVLPLLFYGLAASTHLLTSEMVIISTMEPDLFRKLLFGLHNGLLASIFLRGAFGEEFGLRGFALPTLQKRYRDGMASLIIGASWGLWHLPVLIGRGPIDIVLYIILVLGLSHIFTWLFTRSGGSLIPVILFHGFQNWEDGFEIIIPSLIGTEWELISSLLILSMGIWVTVLVWRKNSSLYDKIDPPNL